MSSMKSFRESKLVDLVDALHLIIQRLPTSPDGRYEDEVKPPTEYVNPNASHSVLYALVQELNTDKRFGPIIDDPNIIPNLLQAAGNKDAINDRSLIFNETLYFLSRLPEDCKLAKKLSDLVITALYYTIPQPPATFIGTHSSPFSQTAPSSTNSTGGTYAFRSADGSGNNPLCPGLGQAGMPYARSVQSKHPLPPHLLPDTGLVFDALLKARDFKPHPGGNSSMTFAYASLVTHQLFRTDPRDMSKNNTTSYLDLSVLYGYSQAQQDSVRDKEKGRGLLYPDTFSEDRLIFVPPAATALLVLFSRNHNYIADMLLKINERKRWSNPPPEDRAQRAAQDEEIFQTARLVNCGHYMSSVFGDYVAGFLGTVSQGNSFRLQPFDTIKTSTGSLPRGAGNHVSVEFNLLYRWHATTAAADIAWTEDLFQRAFNKPLSEIQLGDFRPAAEKLWCLEVQGDPRIRTFAGLRRGPDGKFSDDDLANILQDSTDKVAGAYRARGTPEVLRVIEIMGMEQARKWGVCTMNEFRKFLGLKPFASFKEWNSDEDIASTAEQLYGHIDNLELYPGLQAEETIPLGRGSGLCCGFTMTRAILGDAIALVRGDRFYTSDYTPNNLTTWGYQECARDPTNGAYGSAIPKLLLRHLPRHYPSNSIYALFPFFTPQRATEILTGLGVVGKYDRKRPSRPTPIPKVVDTIAGIDYVFSNPDKYKVTYAPSMYPSTNDFGFMLVFDEKTKHDWYKTEVLHALFASQSVVNTYVDWYKKSTADLIKQHSYKISGVPGKRVDIVRDVINLVGVHWASDWLMGIPLKTKDHPAGLFTEQQMHDMLMVLHTSVFINVLPERGFFLNDQARMFGDKINDLVKKSIEAAAPSSMDIIEHIEARVSRFLSSNEERACYPFLRRLAEMSISREEMVSQVISLAAGSSVNWSQAIIQVVDFYLDNARAKERTELIDLVHRDDAQSIELLHGYIREAQRLAPQFPGLLRTAETSETIDLSHGRGLDVQAGDLIFSSFRNAQHNAADFPDPETFNPRRPASSYRNQGAGIHICPGIDFTLMTATQVLKVVFSLPNVRRAPGAVGVMASYATEQVPGTEGRMYLDSNSRETPWPGSLTIVYDT
ncbi:hypothetical protein QCA50_015537 [Cerrena zonata]|uniref:Linoleate 8R-lipoxygenase n=1 Tax=Cerrena zonata TaxID=2478898 RepID=A0AAW0FXJ6_9APHY